jgi:hypothetical protein
MLRNVVVSALVIAGTQATWCQPVIQAPYSSSYTLVSLGVVAPALPQYGPTAFLNASTLLLAACIEGCTNGIIYTLPVTRAANGHITVLGAPVQYATASNIDAGLELGPGSVLFARTYTELLYEYKPGSTSPDVTVDLISFGYPNHEFGTLQFVPPGLPGAGVLKMPDFDTGAWYDVALAANGSGTYNVTGVTGPNAIANTNPFGIFYTPLGSDQFASPSVLVNQGYTGPIWAYTLDSNGNPSGAGVSFIGGSFYPYGATLDPLTGDMVFVDLDTELVYEVQGFSPATLTATAGTPQSAIVNQQFATPLTVTLNNPYGAPISGVTVNFAAPSSGATAELSAATAVTGADGTASVTASANGTAGPYAVTATLYGYSATFSLTNVALQSVTLSPTSVIGGNSTTANTVALSSGAPTGGATIALSSSDPSVASVPASVMVTGGSTVSAPFTISTTAVSASTHVSITAGMGTDMKRATLTVKPAALTAVRLAPMSIVGGKSTTGNTVTLNGQAPAGGAVVTLSSSDPSVASVPASVTVAPGATTSPVFTITTTAVAAQTPVTISATYDGVTKTAVLTVDPPVLASLRLSPATVKGGHSTVNNTVTLTGQAPTGGAAVMLTSGDPAVAMPPTMVTVAAGATSATFTITTTPVTSTTVVPITATFGGVSKIANLTVTP